ncbi:dynamin family protein [Methanocella conradii]|uniref:dynamin family protein n=1 Tax=Methanocella conradii TaxID=1175444 RepID=UPI0024B33EC6|nr:dynamin family protein [Methanocella conradii]MDI6897204.1 dynamin family protein [Methanocella conradii]
MQNYSELKNLVRRELNSLRGLISGEAATQEVDALLEKLDSDSFNLAVLGQFKRGKTTFINALLGDNVLPTAVVPLTSIITAIRYGSAPKTTVIYLDGRSEAIEPSQLGDYVTERGNPKNARRVGHVEIEYPSDYLKEGVTIIDTPGIGSTFLHNTEVTYNFLSKVDAAVFMLSVDPPVSEVELKFLEDVRKHVKKLFFVLNKVDNASAAEVSESIAFNGGVIGEKMGAEPKVCPLSARQALEAKLKGDPELLRKSGYTDFEFELEYFLTREKGNVLLRTIVDRALGFVEARRLSLAIEKKTRELSARALEEKAALFNAELERFLRDKDANVHLIEWDVDSIIKTLDEDSGKFKKEMAPVVARQVEEFIDGYPRSGNREFLNAVKGRLYQAVSDACDAWRVREEEKIARLYAEKAKAHAERLDEFVRRIEKASFDIFNVEVKHYSMGCTVDLHTPLFYGIDAFMEEGMLLDTTATALNLLLPPPLFRAQVRGAMREKVERSLDMNLGKIRYAFLESLLKSSKGMKASCESVADTLIASVRSAIERARAEKSMSVDVGKRSAEIGRLLAALDEQRKRLEAIELSYLQP